MNPRRFGCLLKILHTWPSRHACLLSRDLRRGLPPSEVFAAHEGLTFNARRAPMRRGSPPIASPPWRWGGMVTARQTAR